MDGSSHECGDRVRILDLESRTPDDHGLVGTVVRIEGARLVVRTDFAGRETDWPREVDDLERVDDDPRLAMRRAIARDATGVFNVRAGAFWDRRAREVPDHDPLADWAAFLEFEGPARAAVAREVAEHLTRFEASFPDDFVVPTPAAARAKFARERDLWLLSRREPRPPISATSFLEYAASVAPWVARRERARAAHEAEGAVPP